MEHDDAQITAFSMDPIRSPDCLIQLNTEINLLIKLQAFLLEFLPQQILVAALLAE
ncbi:MAG: hypothetical protein JST84_03945 [Acidobacteria bacterium]|nr:hypothetical protein [Acidobacteriota bacterium]